ALFPPAERTPPAHCILKERCSGVAGHFYQHPSRGLDRAAAGRAETWGATATRRGDGNEGALGGEGVDARTASAAKEGASGIGQEIRAAPRAARERAHGPPTIDGFKIALKTKNGRGPPERNGGREGRSSDAGGVGSGGAGAAVALLPRKDSPHTPGAISRSLGDEAAVRSSGGTRA
ncbi:unnamed protein product, partial [Prorocentrum cordatum]